MANENSNLQEDNNIFSWKLKSNLGTWKVQVYSQ